MMPEKCRVAGFLVKILTVRLISPGKVRQAPRGTLTLESCIFSDNQASSSNGGAISISGVSGIDNVTIRGCTFYNNSSAGQAGAIRVSTVTVNLTGNLFFGNTAASYPVIHKASGTVTSQGYNVSDKAAGTGNAATGFASVTGDVFSVTSITFDGDSKPSGASADIKTLTGGSLPSGFPTTYFDGTSRSLPATAGAMKE
ncbi:hypothetical protein AGMMS49944_28170 [Spirochaetia bacterium]|nr:hypothetical protein AGMMS49944_28170 [Spirochaetia bacterium]